MNAFLSNYVKETFLARGHNRNLQLTIESLSKTQDAWRTIITPEEMKRLGLLRPLLQSTVMVENSNLFKNIINNNNAITLYLTSFKELLKLRN